MSDRARRMFGWGMFGYGSLAGLAAAMLWTVTLDRPALAQYGPSVKYQAVSATDTNTNVDFGFRAAHLLLINDGANEAFVDFGGTVATNADFELKAGESLNLLVSPMEDIGIICSAGETATVRVLAMSQ